ncbi:MAG: hypothetical protein HXX18_08105 [Bacteroidetes bacterium]|nr:hypothetical protein [Bacteroidota bacterium]
MKEKLNAKLLTLTVKKHKSFKMQVITFIALLFVMPFAAHSQMYFYYPVNYVIHNYDDDYSDFDIMSVRYFSPFNHFKPYQESENQYKENNIKSLKVSCQDMKKDKNPYLTIEKTFNENGFSTIDKRYNRKGKNVLNVERTFKKSVMTMFKSFESNGKIAAWYETKLDSNGNVTESNSLDNDGSIYFKRTYKYNDKRKTTENCSYKGKKQKLLYRVVYSYYPNGDLESTASYNGKGKLQKFWSYACSSKGEETKNMKDTVKVCKISDFDKDGGFTLTNISTGADGQLSKTVRKFNKDSILIDYAQYDNKNRFVNKRTNNKVSDGWLCEDTYFYTNKQTPRTVRVYKFNDNKKIVQSLLISYNRRGKIVSKSEYDYNEKEYNSKIIHYKKGGELINKSLEYTRNEKNLPVLLIKKDNENNITDKTFFQYQ